MPKLEINFFTIASHRHRIFYLPYMVSTLCNNRTAFAEIMIDDIAAVQPEVVHYLNKYFPERWMIYRLPYQLTRKVGSKKWSSEAATLRWLSTPRKICKFTYIGDVDILFLDKEIARNHYQHAINIGKPYSNIARWKGKRLTGLHFVVTKPYYRLMNSKYLEDIKDQWYAHKLPDDEALLYYMVQEKFGIPETIVERLGVTHTLDGIYRPTHGFHLSLNRKPRQCWGIHAAMLDKYQDLKNTEEWTEALKLFDPEYLKLLNYIY